MSQITPYRVCNSDRLVGKATSDSNGFLVLNRSNYKCYIVSGGLWTASVATLPSVLVDVYNLPSNTPHS